jgi:hypothetical protein
VLVEIARVDPLGGEDFGHESLQLPVDAHDLRPLVCAERLFRSELMLQHVEVGLATCAGALDDALAQDGDGRTPS